MPVCLQRPSATEADSEGSEEEEEDDGWEGSRGAGPQQPAVSDRTRLTQVCMCVGAGGRVGRDMYMWVSVGLGGKGREARECVRGGRP